jgi:biopolymer transport protein ExbB
VALGSNIATLLGLLGTIMGLITAFTAVANANAAEKADLLSASISVAMNTTAFGLMVGITLLVIHALLNSLTGEIVDSLEMASVKALNAITSATRRRIEVTASEGETNLFDGKLHKGPESKPGAAQSETAGDKTAEIKAAGTDQKTATSPIAPQVAKPEFESKHTDKA